MPIGIQMHKRGEALDAPSGDSNTSLKHARNTTAAADMQPRHDGASELQPPSDTRDSAPAPSGVVYGAGHDTQAEIGLGLSAAEQYHTGGQAADTHMDSLPQGHTALAGLPRMASLAQHPAVMSATGVGGGESAVPAMDQPILRPMTAKKAPPKPEDTTPSRKSRLRPPEQHRMSKGSKEVNLYKDTQEDLDDDPITIIQESPASLIEGYSVQGALVNDIVQAKKAADDAVGVHQLATQAGMPREQGITLERTKRSRHASAPRADITHARDSVQHVVQHIVPLVRCMDYLQVRPSLPLPKTLRKPVPCIKLASNSWFRVA
jgi:hypothetical protein